jgi:hypothetical protein
MLLFLLLFDNNAIREDVWDKHYFPSGFHKSIGECGSIEWPVHLAELIPLKIFYQYI